MSLNIIRFILIGSLHSTVYLFLLPKVIIPIVGSEARGVATGITVSATILTTIVIARTLKKVKK